MIDLDNCEIRNNTTVSPASPLWAAQRIFNVAVVLFSQLYAAITEANDREEVQEYAELVGPAVSSRMLLFRSG